MKKTFFMFGLIFSFSQNYFAVNQTEVDSCNVDDLRLQIGDCKNFEDLSRVC